MKKFFTYNKKSIFLFWVYIAVLLIIFRGIIGINYVSSGSMEPTLMTGDLDIHNRLAYVVKSPKRGDIVTFKSKESKDILCKRVIGVAGDTIEFHDGYVYINGELYDETDYLDEDVETNSISVYKVPQDCVFVLGDNRENSRDSRFFENPYVKVSNVKSKHIITVPLPHLGSTVDTVKN